MNCLRSLDMVERSVVSGRCLVSWVAIELGFLGSGGFGGFAAVGELVEGVDQQDSDQDEDQGEDVFPPPGGGPEVGVFDDDGFLPDGFFDVFLEGPDTAEGADHEAAE